MRKSFVVVITLLLATCSCAPVVAPPASALPDAMSLHLTVLQHIVSPWRHPGPRYICIQREDPSVSLLGALQSHSTVPLQPCSAAPPAPTALNRQSLELPYVLFQIHEVSWTDANHAIVVAGFYCGALCGGIADYHCRRDSDGRWRVDHVENEIEA